jgi:hypothetical protein
MNTGTFERRAAAGVIVARPGEDSGGELLVDLQPGRRYLVICTLPTRPTPPAT